MEKFSEHTIRYRGTNEADKTQHIVGYVYQALAEKGYDPIDQLVGYLLTGDPVYITSHAGARDLIRGIDRDVLLEHVLEAYAKNNAFDDTQHETRPASKCR